MATIPTTDCSFGDIVIAYNTTFPSTPVSTNNINLKTYFSGKTVYSPGGTGTVIPTSNISTSLFYGKTFGSGPNEPTLLSGVSYNTNSCAFSWTDTSDWGTGSTASRQYRLRLYKGTAPSTPGGAGYTSEIVLNPPATTAGWALLVQGESYWFSIRAETDIGESNWVLSPETIVLLPLKIIKIQSRQPGEVISAVRIIKPVSDPGLPGSWEYFPDGSTSGLWDWCGGNPCKDWAPIYTMDPYEYIIGIRYGKSPITTAVSYLQIYTWDTSISAAGSHNNQVLTDGSEFGEGSFVTINATSGNHITEITGSSNITGSGWADSVPRVLTITGQQAY